MRMRSAVASILAASASSLASRSSVADLSRISTVPVAQKARKNTATSSQHVLPEIIPYHLLISSRYSPLRVREGKLTNAVKLSLARTGQDQKYDRLKMRWDERIELVSH